MRALVRSLTGLLLLSTSALAGQLAGTVRDSETGQALPAASIFLDNTPYGAFSDKDGVFALAGVPEGRYGLTVRYIGYGVYKTRVLVTGEPTTLVVRLVPVVLPGQTVIVTATRAKDRQTPVAFSNLTRQDIRQRYYAQDVPMVLQTMPSAYAYSDAGNGIGYSYLNIRGFNQMRINVLINGIPHNGPTSHEVYWIDLPDLLASAADVQVQRGVGSSLYGSSALGGTVNVVTTDFSTEPSLSLYAGMGLDSDMIGNAINKLTNSSIGDFLNDHLPKSEGYNTRKYSFSYNSGLVNNSYVMYGRFSRIRSDGYRDQSWTSLWSYSLGVARFDPTVTTRFLVYGGPEQTHLAYNGVDSTYIKGLVTGDVRRDRKYNPLTYENELDNFNQPHYELHNDWHITDKLLLDNTLYTIKGKGSYDQYRTRRDLEEFRLPTFKVKDPTLYPTNWYERDDAGNPLADANGEYTVTKSDLIKSRWVENDEYGWLPRASWDHGKGTLSVGGEVRHHVGRHWAMVSWLAATPPGTDPDHVYYAYHEKKLTLSGYVHEVYRPTSKLTLMGDLQAVQHTYYLEQDTVSHYSYKVNYRWLTPRVGVNYNLTERVNLFANASMANREPITSDLVDPQDYYTEPNFTTRDTVRTGGRITDIRLSNTTVKPEQVIDYELGAGYRSSRFSATGNLYYMDFRNEIVPYGGQISEASGLPITGNAQRSVHDGIEFEATARPLDFLEVSGNVNFNDDHFVKYTEYCEDWDAGEYVSGIRDGKRIAGFPTMLANLRALVARWGFTAGMTWRYVGRQYLDNSENAAHSLAPYQVTDLSLAYRFDGQFGIRGLELRLQVNNVFDRLYEAGGYMDDVYAVASEGKIYGTPYYIPAATRNTFLGMQWTW